MALPVRTLIPLAGANARAADHNLYDFRAAYPTAGNYYFVHNSGSSSGTGLSPADPVTTIDAAINLCTANQGDVIFVLPGHSETITAASGIAQDVAGVSIIGLGYGDDRPLVSFGTNTTATWTISAASCLVKNIRVKATVDELVSMFVVSAPGVTVDGVDYVDNTTVQALQFLLTTAAGDYLTVKNLFHWKGTACAGTEKWISLVGSTHARILDSTFFMVLRDNAAACVISADANSRLTEIGRVRTHVTGYTSGLVSNVIGASGATGIHYDSRHYSDTTIVTTINDAPSMASFEVYCSNDLDKNGLLDPVVGS